MSDRMVDVDLFGQTPPTDRGAFGLELHHGPLQPLDFLRSHLHQKRASLLWRRRIWRASRRWRAIRLSIVRIDRSQCPEEVGERLVLEFVGATVIATVDLLAQEDDADRGRIEYPIVAGDNQPLPGSQG